MFAAASLPIASVAYVVGIFLAILATIYRTTTWRRVASVVFVLAWVVHLVAVVGRGLQAGQVPLSNGGEYLLALGLAVMTAQLILWFRWRVDAVSLVLLPLAAAAVFAALAVLPAQATGDVPSPRGLFLFHTTVSTLGMATLCVALAMSVIYLVQDRALKSRRTLRLLERLPPLDRCDQIGHHALVYGFVLLTLGIVTGVVVNTRVHEQLWVLGAKQMLPIVAWLVFAAILAARIRVGFRGRKSAYLTITGVALGLLSVVGMTI